MVSRIINLLNREFRNINQAAIILGFFTLVSQILAMFRDRMFAHYLGPSATLDVYYASFKIPDLLFVSVASLASITVLLPFLVEKIGVNEKGELNGGSASARKLLHDIFTVFLLVMIGVSVIAFIFMPELVKLIAPGFNALELKELTGISRIMLLSPILLGLSNLFGSVTQMFKKFFRFCFITSLLQYRYHPRARRPIPSIRLERTRYRCRSRRILTPHDSVPSFSSAEILAETFFQHRLERDKENHRALIAANARTCAK